MVLCVLVREEGIVQNIELACNQFATFMGGNLKCVKCYYFNDSSERILAITRLQPQGLSKNTYGLPQLPEVVFGKVLLCKKSSEDNYIDFDVEEWNFYLKKGETMLRPS